ncbi:hypothetical protein PVAND_014054 [Polypedilum vanderplanki]|uniref:Uncharacterized protein n=1 Tax=Polypedilum vanderplanki TaxID=319348 RepID=A0A9J6CTA5_POLVA|nr:hypothetical protein PVAND_014054 [Polypedilum vanderplanki]
MVKTTRSRSKARSGRSKSKSANRSQSRKGQKSRSNSRVSMNDSMVVKDSNKKLRQRNLPNLDVSMMSEDEFLKTAHEEQSKRKSKSKTKMQRQNRDVVDMLFLRPQIAVKKDEKAGIDLKQKKIFQSCMQKSQNGEKSGPIDIEGKLRRSRSKTAKKGVNSRP